jgi:hypothetical protein
VDAAYRTGADLCGTGARHGEYSSELDQPANATAAGQDGATHPLPTSVVSDRSCSQCSNVNTPMLRPRVPEVRSMTYALKVMYRSDRLE